MSWMRRSIVGMVAVAGVSGFMGCEEIQEVVDPDSSAKKEDPRYVVNLEMPKCDEDGNVIVRVKALPDNKPLVSAVAFLQTSDYAQAAGAMETAIADNKPVEKASSGERKVASMEHFALAASYEMMERHQDAVTHYRTSNQYLSTPEAQEGKKRAECKADM